MGNAFVTASPDPNAEITANQQLEEGWELIHVAAKKGDVNTVKTLVQQDKLVLEAMTDSGLTPLAISMLHRQTECSQLLLQASLENTRQDIHQSTLYPHLDAPPQKVQPQWDFSQTEMFFASSSPQDSTDYILGEPVLEYSGDSLDSSMAQSLHSSMPVPILDESQDVFHTPSGSPEVSTTSMSPLMNNELSEDHIGPTNIEIADLSEGADLDASVISASASTNTESTDSVKSSPQLYNSVFNYVGSMLWGVAKQQPNKLEKDVKVMKAELRELKKKFKEPQPTTLAGIKIPEGDNELLLSVIDKLRNQLDDMPQKDEAAAAPPPPPPPPVAAPPPPPPPPPMMSDTTPRPVLLKQIKKERGPLDYKKELSKLIKESSVAQENVSKVAEAYFNAFGQDRLDMLNDLINHYGFLITTNPTNPQDAVHRYLRWENGLFKKIEDEKERNALRKRKRFEIEKFAGKADIKKQCGLALKAREREIAKKLEAAKRKQVEAKKAGLMDELKNKLDARSAAEDELSAKEKEANEVRHIEALQTVQLTFSLDSDEDEDVGEL